MPLFRALAGSLVLHAAANAASIPLVVDLLTSPPPLQTVLAVQVCAGLINRNATSTLSAYTIMHPEDWEWLVLVEPNVPNPPPLTTPTDFIHTCLAVAATGRVRYSFEAQQALVPNMLTLAAVLDGVPLEDGSPFLEPGLPVVFDAITAWESFSPLNATEFVYNRYVNATTTMAKMDPGYNFTADPLACALPLTG